MYYPPSLPILLSDVNGRELARFTVLLIVFAAISLPVHEYSHYGAALLTGGDGYMKENHFYPTRPSTWAPWLMPFAGGLGVAAIYALLSLAFNDPGEDIAVGYTLVEQLIYGLGEGALFALGAASESSLSAWSLAGTVIALAYVGVAFIGWFRSPSSAS